MELELEVLELGEVELPLAPVEDVLEEQAARPAARRVTAAAATTLLLEILLSVNFDLSSRVSRFEKEFCFSG